MLTRRLIDDHGIGLVRVLATLALAVGTALVHPHPGFAGIRLTVLVALVVAVAGGVSSVGVARDGLGMLVAATSLSCAGGVLAMISPTGPAPGLLLVGMATAGRELTLELAVGALATTVLVTTVVGVVHHSDAAAIYGYVGGAAGLVLMGRSRRQALLRAEQSELLLAQTRRSQEEHERAATLAERARIARDLHDVLAHSLSALAIQIEGARALVERDAPRERVLPLLEDARGAVARGLAESRRAVAALREDARSLPELLTGLVSEHQATGATTELELSEGVGSELEPSAALALYRVAQEALTNIRKHAPDGAARIELAPGDGGVLLRVINPLSASEVGRPTGGGYGLRGMRERLQEKGGSLSAGVTPDGTAWLVEAWLPPRAELSALVPRPEAAVHDRS